MMKNHIIVIVFLMLITFSIPLKKASESINKLSTENLLMNCKHKHNYRLCNLLEECIKEEDYIGIVSYKDTDCYQLIIEKPKKFYQKCLPDKEQWECNMLKKCLENYYDDTKECKSLQ